MDTIKILIADDHPLVADSLSMLLNTEEDFQIVGTVTNGLLALEFLAKYEVDVLLADYHMPVINGVELVLKAKEKGFKVKTIMLTMNEEATFIKESIQAGVKGYVMKSAEKPELINAIRTVALGGTFFGDGVMRKLTEISSPGNANIRMQLAEIQSLTKREIEIIRLVSEDLSNNEIAHRLSLSVATVETHRRNLMKKIGVNSSIGLMKWGIKNGILND